MTAAADRQLDDLRRSWRGYWPEQDAAALAADVRARRAAALAAWELTDPEPLPGGNVAAVLAARRDGAPVVLKVSPGGHPDAPQLAGEGAALRFWQPTGAVPRVHATRDGGLTLLLERVVPGTPLDAAGLPLPRRLTLLGRLAARLHAAGPPPRDSLHIGDDYARDWRTSLAEDRVLGPLLDRLLRERDDDRLIHADLHGGNALLADGERWLVIDPHAVRADRHADVWALIDPLVPTLPADREQARAAVRERVAAYAAAAELEPARAADWTRVRSRAEALALDGDAEAGADERARALQLHRVADALA